MGREMYLLAHKEEKTKKAIAGMLRKIADKVESGNVTMTQGTESLFINLFDGMSLEVKVEEQQKHVTKCSFNFELFVARYNQNSMVIG